MGLPLDTTAAQPKLKLYRYVSPSLSLSLSAILFLFSDLSLSLSLPVVQPSLSRPISPSPSHCVYLPFRSSFSFPRRRSFSWPFLFPSYVRSAIVNGLQPLPGIYPRNLPSATSVSPLALTQPHPSESLGGIPLPTALFKQRDTFPSTTSQFSPGRGPICFVFRVTCTHCARVSRFSLSLPSSLSLSVQSFP